MHRTYEATKHLIPPENLVELRYEELVKDPIHHLEAIYDKLQLGWFESVRAAAEKYLASQQNYQTNRYELSPQMRETISKRWRDYIERHGYQSKDSGAAFVADKSAQPSTPGQPPQDEIVVSHRW